MDIHAYKAPEGYSFEYLSEVVSTNDIALQKGAGSIVCAARQTGGRGRMGRAFSSEEGGLYFSMAVRPPCELSDCLSLPAVAALCAQKAIGGAAKIKWPNDIMLTDKKVCGILTENRDGVIVFGFGINLENALPPELTEAGRVQADVCALLTSITHALDEALRGYPENRPALLQEYCGHCLTLGKFVDVTYRGMPLYGFACALDKHGGLMIMTQESRTVVTVYSGEASLSK